MQSIKQIVEMKCPFFGNEMKTTQMNTTMQRGSRVSAFRLSSSETARNLQLNNLKPMSELSYKYTTPTTSPAKMLGPRDNKHTLPPSSAQCC